MTTPTSELIAHAPKQKPEMIDVSLEKALDLIAQMTDTTTKETDSTKVVHGQHPELGDLYVVIPPLGNPLLLPIAIRNLTL